MLNDTTLYNFVISKKFFVGSFMDFVLLGDVVKSQHEQMFIEDEEDERDAKVYYESIMHVGWKASEAGKELADNPHENNTPEYESWNEGFYSYVEYVQDPDDFD